MVEHLKPENRGFVDMYPNLDTGTGIHERVYIIIIFLKMG